MIVLLGALLAAPQELEDAPPTPYDQVIELELTAEDPALIEGWGPTAVVEYEVDFEGTLHVWAESELDLFLQVDDAFEARPLASDDDSGGGTTPFARIEVHEGDRLATLVAARPAGSGPLSLWFVPAPETDATQGAARAGREHLQQAARLLAAGDRAGANERITTLMAELIATPGVRTSDGISDLSFDVGILAYDELANLEAASAAFGIARSHGEETLPPDHPHLSLARNNLANAIADAGDLEGALALREEVLASYERTLPTDHPDVLRARHNLASSLAATGNAAGARALREAVLRAYERILPEDHPVLLAAMSNLVSSLVETGDLSRARPLCETVLEGFERTLPPDHFQLMLARGNLAGLMEQMGDLAGARVLREEVLATCERTLSTDHPELLAARSDLANSLDKMGDRAGARALREEVLATCERTLPEDHPWLLRARHDLANSMYAVGDVAGARALLEAVLAVFERTLPPTHTDLLRTRHNLANAMLEDPAEARDEREAVLAACEELLPTNHPQLLAARTGLADSMVGAGDLAGARAQREAVLAAFERTVPADDPSLLSARTNLALTLYEMGELAEARAQLPALASGMTRRVLGALALAPRQALGTAVAENDRLSKVVFLSESAGSTEQELAFALTETLRLVGGEAARSLAGYEQDDELAPILAEAARVRRELNDLVAGAATDHGTEDLSSTLTRLSLERDRLESEASGRLAERGVAVQPVDVPVLSAVLGDGDVAVGYRRIQRWERNANGSHEAGTDHMLAHVVTSDGTLTRIDLGPAPDLEALARRWRQALGAPLLGRRSAERGVEGVRGGTLEVSGEVRTGRRLRGQLLDPVLAAAGEEARRIFFCGDDLVLALPLDALPLEDANDGRVGDGRRLVNEVSFARLLASSDLAPGDSSPSLLSLGGVDYDAAGLAPSESTGASPPLEGASNSSRSGTLSGFGPIPYTKLEAEAVAALYEERFEAKPVLLAGQTTTKAALFRHAPGKRYLHVATHGWFAPDSIRSMAGTTPVDSMRMGIEERVAGLAPMTLCGLALAGANHGRDSLGRVPGILTAEELCSLDLSQCELAVLSACETNVGIRRAGQGIQSLQAALYAAGARSSITSLWKVDDAATRRLMKLFYTNLWVEKMGKADALWQAKCALREEGHPVRDWAGWVLTGDPD